MAEFTIHQGFFGKSVVGKLGRMRKPQVFAIRPTDDDRLIVQSDKSIGIMDFTGKGKLFTGGKGKGYFPYLALAEPFEFPAEFVKLALECAPALDAEITRGGVTIQTTVKVVK